MPDGKKPTSPSAGLPEQRLQALHKANEIRTGRARVKKELMKGTVRIEEVLAQPPEFAKGANVRDLLLVVPGLGPARVARLLARCRISEAKTVFGLSDRQRSALIDHFRR